VDGVLRRQDAILDPSGALDGRVRVQLDHGRAGRHRFRAVDLDFEVALRDGQARQEGEKDRNKELAQHGAIPSGAIVRPRAATTVHAAMVLITARTMTA